ncbi:SAM-dependent methyltransferase [Cordyceps fumosorosea ARSEF 2679]|uniref:SAM-dependent methyltransferase n=1 Tax=Cordyceps fumosorosea (strain ARSEF 2679) TaxID=1081104 RepID=A0A167NLP0_CORFA|nr:SAM-dependent methyltransferase [Cordyceps fumosorosea ARSEF 2679]OAA55692.1 SAM-dependent methyltransferase [Cordyceps fumosorosea ARSEF 2679]
MHADEEILDTLSACFLHNGPGRVESLDNTFAHRIQLCRAWGLDALEPFHVLDVGCGQAESTAVLAYFAGEDGHATGLDPAEPSYGAPFTVQQSQDYLRQSSPLGPRITFARRSLPEFLATANARSTVFDMAVFCHSLWYFTGSDAVHDHFVALAGAGIPRVCLAEYSTASADDDPAQRPHQLAARAQMRLHAAREQHLSEAKPSTLNVRGALEVEELLRVAESAGWSVTRRGIVSPPAGMRDGYWEAGVVTSPRFREGIISQGLPKEQEDSVLEFIPQIGQAIEHLKSIGEPVATMDVAWAVLERQPA